MGSIKLETISISHEAGAFFNQPKPVIMWNVK